MVWRHRLWGAAEFTPEVSNGIFFYGEKETIFVNDSRWVVIPKAKGEPHRVIEVKGDKRSAAHAEFSRLGPQPQGVGVPAGRRVPFDYDGTTRDDFVQVEVPRELEPAEGDDYREHQRLRPLLKREYRAPYRHPYAG